MSEITTERMAFFEQLHEFFLMKKGYGAFAFISINDAINLFDKYLDSSEPADLFIKRYVNSFK